MPAIELRDIKKSFGGIQVLLGLTLEIQAGERHAIIGPNGAGKSTLFNIISGKLSATDGQVFHDGEDITGQNPAQIVRRGIARGFQIINVFPELTVFENVRAAVVARAGRQYNMARLLGRDASIRADTLRVLADVDLAGLENEPASQLSYGDQRRLEIALVHALDPKVMLLDEPCAGLNPADTQQAINMIRRVTEGRTLLMIEHDMEVVFGIADRVTVIHYGKVLATGKPQDIRSNAAVTAAYLGRAGHAA